MNGKIRLRATAVVMRDGAVLLVRDRGARAYSLPGGRREPIGAFDHVQAILGRL